MASRRPTLAKVAAVAGVSISQASDALRGGGRVSAATQERVRAAAIQLGYQTQTVARVLREGVTDFVAVVADREATNAPDGSIYPFWGKFLTSFTLTLREYGYAVILDFDSAAADINRLPAQGILMLTTDVDRLQAVKGGGFGRVVALTPEADATALIDSGANVLTIRHDHSAIAADAVAYLAERGCRRVAVQPRPGNHSYMTLIRSAMAEAAAEVGIELVDPEPLPDDTHFLDGLRRLLAGRRRIDGIFDFTGGAPALLAVLDAAGRRPVPKVGAKGGIVVMAQGEGTGAGVDPRLAYLSLLGGRCGELLGEHVVAALYGRALPWVLFPHEVVPAAE